MLFTYCKGDKVVKIKKKSSEYEGETICFDNCNLMGVKSKVRENWLELSMRDEAFEESKNGLQHWSILHLCNKTKHQQIEFENQFSKALFEVFSFRFAVYREVCVMNSLNLITKLMITYGIKMSTLVNIFLILFLYKSLSTQ